MLSHLDKWNYNSLKANMIGHLDKCWRCEGGGRRKVHLKNHILSGGDHGKIPSEDTHYKGIVGKREDNIPAMKSTPDSKTSLEKYKYIKSITKKTNKQKTFLNVTIFKSITFKDLLKEFPYISAPI